MAGQTKLMLPSGGSVSISASDSTQNTTVTLPGGDVTLATTSQVMGRNRIINGAMMIDQRNAGASVTPTADSTYTLDRWCGRLSQTSKYSVQQNAGSVTPPAGYSSYLGVTSLSSFSVASGDYFALEQRIEGFNTNDLAWGTASAKSVTLSFWVRSSLTGTFGGSIVNGSPYTPSYPFAYTISSANTWEQKTVTISGPTTGTWNSTNGLGLSVFFGLGLGSSYGGTAGSWANATYLSATGAQSVVGTNGATFYITGVQLEKATTATPFEFRPYGQELALCQRYLPAYNQPTSNAYIAPVFMYSTTGAVATIAFPVSARVAPTGVSFGGTAQIDGTANFSISSVAAAVSSVNSGSVTLTGTGYVAGQAGGLLLKGATSATQLLFTGCEL